jgi:DNA-binding response OmpR family regulator
MQESVLVVEGDQDLADVLFEALEDEGFVVSLQADLQPAAIQAAVAHLEPDVVLLDRASRFE